MKPDEKEINPGKINKSLAIAVFSLKFESMEYL